MKLRKRLNGILGLAAVLVMAGAGFVRAQETDRSVDYNSFRIISERNIFDSSRSARPATPPASRQVERRPPPESFSLLGTMVYDQGSYAVFDGSNSQLRGVLTTGDTIGGYRVAVITLNHVQLESEDRVVELPLGGQMTREEEGRWLLAARSDTDEADSDRTATRAGDRTDRTFGRRSTGGSSRPAPSSPGAARSMSAEDESEILKRLMEKRREQELNQ